MSDAAAPPDGPGRPAAAPAGDTPPGGPDAPDATTPAAEALRTARVAWDRLLDVVVFVPVGFATETVEHLPQWAATGRAKLGMQLGNARVTGQFVVRKAQRDYGQRLTRLRPGGRRSPTPARTPATGTSAGRDLPPPPASVDPRPTGMPGPVTLPSERTTTAAAAAAIEGYDTLSASQVVRRLDGLGPEELRAVYRHEAATRGRRTILHRVQQLLNPGSAPTAEGADDGGANGAGSAGTAPGVPAANRTTNGTGTAETT